MRLTGADWAVQDETSIAGRESLRPSIDSHVKLGQVADGLASFVGLLEFVEPGFLATISRRDARGVEGLDTTIQGPAYAASLGIAIALIVGDVHIFFTSTGRARLKARVACLGDSAVAHRGEDVTLLVALIATFLIIFETLGSGHAYGVSTR